MYNSSRIGLLSLIAAGVFCLVGSCHAVDTECIAGICGAVDSEIDEPVFGYSYFPSQASFERISPESLGTECFDLAKENFFDDGKVLPWIYLYGDYQNGDTRLIIVGVADGTAIFVRHGQSCADGGVVLTLQQRHGNPPGPYAPPYLSQKEIEGIFADLLRRYAAAFGDKAKFFAWLDPLTKSGLDQCIGMSQAYCHPTWHDLPPNLQAMLEAFREGRNE